MVVLVLEEARARTEELNDKLKRLSLLIAASTQTLSMREMLDQVLVNVVGSLGVSHGLVRLLHGEGKSSQLMVHGSRIRKPGTPSLASAFATNSRQDMQSEKGIRGRDAGQESAISE